MNMPKELPLGFGMALAQNEKALRAFSTLPQGQKQTVIAQAGQVRSKQEMQHLVDSIAP